MAEQMTADPTHMPDEDAPDLPKDGGAEKKKRPRKVKPAVDEKDIVEHFRGQVSAAERNRDSFKNEWKENVDVRLGKNPTVYTAGINISADLQSEYNPDWSLTQVKTANLYSQLPDVQLSHNNDQYAPAVGPYRKALNYELGSDRADVGSILSENLNDAVNAAGVMACYCGYAARFDTVKIPVNEEIAKLYATMPPEQQKLVEESGAVEMKEVPRRTSYQYFCVRISPPDFLWPAAFTGSNFNKSPWLGFSGSMPWAEAKTELKLSDDQREDATRGSTGNSAESVQGSLQATEDQRQANLNMKAVRYKRIFYWRYLVDPDEKSMYRIWEIVFVDGISKPTVHEAWKGQEWDEQNRQVLGARLLPVRAMALTYVSDNPVPPSDTRAGRPQVIDMRRSRSQMFMNRERSFPIRGFNTNAVDPEIRDLILSGEYQGWIPFNGNQQNSIWEVARASYPSEDLAFDRQAKVDLDEIWHASPSQMGQTGVEKTKAEVQVTAAAFGTVIGQERARVSEYLIGIARVFAGLMSITNYDFPNLTDQQRQAVMQAWDMKKVIPDLVFKIRPAAMVLLDPNARMKQLSDYLNITVKSGFVNPLPILAEMTELANLDPAEVLHQPQPKQPDEPQISYRFNGKEDLQNPVSVGILMKRGQLPNPEELNQAKLYLQQAQMPPMRPQPQQPGQPGRPQPQPPMVQPGQAHPQWSLASKIAKRSRDISGG